ncbi:MAG: hypothetical protein V3V25_02380 [Paracoccaceae bacterium]
MNIDNWLKISSRINARKPVDIDSEIFDVAPPEAKGSCLEQNYPKDWLPPSLVNWKLEEEDRVSIGIKITERLENFDLVATRLVAMATERAITPIILSTIAPSGLERFGFRVERLAGKTQAQQDACEAELKQFWDIAIVIEAADILKMR